MIELKSMKQLDTLLDHGHLFLLKIYTPTCHPCKILNGELLELEEDKEVRRLGVGFYSINATEHPEAAQKYHVMSVPYTIIFKNGIYTYSIGGFKPKLTINKIKQKLLELQPTNKGEENE